MTSTNSAPELRANPPGSLSDAPANTALASAPLEAQVNALLRAGGKTISTAESCTGGLIAHLLTNVPGSSACVLGGVVAYDNQVKQALLNVREETLIEYGAVSEPTARQMAINVRALFGSDYALSVTGIAGPGGGTADKPVGLTYIGCVDATGQVRIERHIWDGDREANKLASAQAALRLLLNVLQTGADAS